jgi:hypothetical protein
MLEPDAASSLASPRSTRCAASPEEMCEESEPKRTESANALIPRSLFPQVSIQRVTLARPNTPILYDSGVGDQRVEGRSPQSLWMFVRWRTGPAGRVCTAGTQGWLLSGNDPHSHKNGDGHEGKGSDHDFVEVMLCWAVTYLSVGVDHELSDAAASPRR